MPSAGRLRYLERLPDASVRPRGTLLLVHAFPLNARMFEAQLALAGSGWRVIAPHLRGFGGGTADAPATSVDDHAGDVIDLLDTLHIDEAVIGGVSMGGYIAFAIFRHAPRYFQGLILSDTKSQADTPEGIEGRKKMLQLVEAKGAAGVAEDMVPKLLGETTKRSRPTVVEEVRSLILANSADGIAGAVRALMTRPDSASLLSTIHCPTLILVGEEDGITPPPLAEEMQRGIAGSQLKVFPAAGHLPNLETPDTFNATLAEFLTHRV
jgi:3-oxoadipate enol-lactonase